MKRLFWPTFFSITIILSGCASFRVAGEVESGRQAYLVGKPEAALSHFRSAADVNPQFVYRFSPLQQGIWTYVGKSYYDLGKLPEARQALERATSADRDDYVAQIYLGLTLAKNGDRERGLKELESGMKGLYDWLDHIEYYTNYGEFWDPSKKIRSTIQTDLAMISGKEINWQRLIDDAESVGKKIEAEIDRARFDERKELLQDGDDDGGQP